MPKFTVEALVEYPDDRSETPIYNGLDRAQLHRWLDKLLDTEPDLIKFTMVVVKEV